MPLDLPTHLLPRNLPRTETARSGYMLRVPPGIGPAEVTEPDFWAHLAAKLKVFDKIEIVAEDGSFDMEARVLALDPRGLWAQLRVLSLVVGEAVPRAPAGQWPDKDGYTVEYGGVHRWRIINGAGAVVEKDFPEEAAALAALAKIKAAKRKAA